MYVCVINTNLWSAGVIPWSCALVLCLANETLWVTLNSASD